MSRKLVFSAVSALALVTLVVSAQQPGQLAKGPGQTADQPPASTSASISNNPFWTTSKEYANPVMGMNREEHQLAHESGELVKQLRSAEGDNKEKIKSKLTETLGKQFDLRQKRHESEIAILEAQLKRLKEMVQKRQENRKDIIGKRLDQLVREAEGLGW